jgi:uncharacterized membrane protein YfcA
MSPPSTDRLRVPLGLGVGAAAGLVSGLLEVAGGAILVPGLMATLRLSRRQAVATTLLAAVPITIAGAILFYVGTGHGVRADLALALGVGCLVGTRGGVAIAQRVPENVLRVAFALLLLAVAARLLTTFLP